MKCKITFLLIVTIILVNSCKKEGVGNNNSSEKIFTISQAKVLQSSNKFGIKLFSDLADNYPNTKNLFISPLSVYLALTMTYNGAANTTALEMQNTLGYSGMVNEEINQSCKDLVDVLLNIDPKITLEIANSIWYRNTFTVKQVFIDINRHYFNAEVKASDFYDPATVIQINNWVKTKTHDKIEKVIDNIPSNAVMYLINAIYFKGIWKYKFDSENTVEGPFNTPNSGSVLVNFMNQKARFKYMDNDLLSAIELPYGNSGLSMVVLLPVQDKTIPNVIQNFSQDNWTEWCNNMDSTEVTVRLPKFKFAYDSTINESLKTLGMPTAFTPMADFSNINSDESLCISKVLHKSFIEVNEEGSEAAAVTVVGIVTTAFPGENKDKNFVANKPFIFVIKENTTQTILFAGIVNNPNIQ
jgi:serpin B